MYFARVDLIGKNITARQGYALPECWQGVAAVKALKKEFGEDSVGWVAYNDLYLERFLTVKTNTESKGEKDDLEKDVSKTARGRRNKRNRPT